MIIEQLEAINKHLPKLLSDHDTPGAAALVTAEAKILEAVGGFGGLTATYPKI